MELQNDVDVVCAAIAQNGNALKFASQEIQQNKKVVLQAVEQNGNSLKFAG